MMVDLTEPATADEAPAGYRMTELGVLPEEWQVAPLGDLATIRGETINPSQRPDLRYVGLEHLVSGDPRARSWGDARQVRSAKSAFFPGDLLYGKLRPYLDKGAVSEWAGMSSTDILVITPGDRIDPAFLGYVVHTQDFIRHAVATTTGVNHPRTSWSALRGFLLPLPPLPEQRAIAHVLSTVQRAREATEAVIAATRELKRSLMRHLFTYGPVPVDQVAGVRLKETEIGWVPEGWEVQALGSVAAQTQYGLSIRGEKVGRYPILRMNSLQGGQILIDDLQYVDLDIQNATKFMLRQGDVIFNRTNSFDLVGKTALFDLLGDYVFASYLVRLAVDRESLDPAWINQYLNWTPTQARLKGLASRGVSQSNISASKLRTLPIPLPPLAEQEATTRKLCALDRKLEVDKRRLRSLDETLKTTLHNLMTGAMRVPC